MSHQTITAPSNKVDAPQMRERPVVVRDGAATWQIRVTTAHKNGRSRESRFQLDLE